jgi:hypothetical protein
MSCKKVRSGGIRRRIHRIEDYDNDTKGVNFIPERPPGAGFAIFYPGSMSATSYRKRRYWEYSPLDLSWFSTFVQGAMRISHNAKRPDVRTEFDPSDLWAQLIGCNGLSSVFSVVRRRPFPLVQLQGGCGKFARSRNLIASVLTMPWTLRSETSFPIRRTRRFKSRKYRWKIDSLDMCGSIRLSTLPKLECKTSGPVVACVAIERSAILHVSIFFALGQLNLYSWVQVFLLLEVSYSKFQEYPP